MAYDFVSVEHEDANYSNRRDHARTCAAAPLALLADLQLAQRLLPADPDAAGLLLDGALWRVVALVFARAGLDAPACDSALAELERIAPPVAWRVRLALRAPDARARLIHIWSLLDAVGGQSGGVAPSR